MSLTETLPDLALPSCLPEHWLGHSMDLMSGKVPYYSSAVLFQPLGVNNENGMSGVSFSRKEPPFETDQSERDFVDEEISAAV